MIPSNSIAYIQGLLRMASSYAAAMRPSVIQAEGFDRNQYARQFAEKYRLPEEAVKPKAVDASLRDMLKRWIEADKGQRGDRMITRWVERLIRYRLGHPVKLMQLATDAGLPVSLAGCEALRQVQGLFFAVYKEGALCFMLGRSE